MRAEESEERDIGTRAGKGIDIGGPGGDGDRTKDGRGGAGGAPWGGRGAEEGAAETQIR